MRRTRMMLAAGAVAVSLSVSGTGVALAQSEGDPDLAAQCAAYSFIEWLLIGHECHGHTPPYIVYWPSGF
jgi:hypothetical protein